MAFPTDVGGLQRRLDEQRAILAGTAGAIDERTVRKRGDALWTMGEDLLRLGQLEEGADRLGEAAATLWPFEQDRGLAVLACSRQATALMNLDRDDDAYEALKGAIEKIGLEWSDPHVPDLMPLALADWLDLLHGKAYSGESLTETAVEVADVVLRRYAGDTPTQRIAIGRALRWKAVSAIMQADWPETLVFCDDVIRRCPVEEDDAVRGSSVEMWLSALTTRGFVLEQLARRDEALASYEEALGRGESVTSVNLNVRKILKDAKDGRRRITSARRARRARLGR